MKFNSFIFIVFLAIPSLLFGASPSKMHKSLDSTTDSNDQKTLKILLLGAPGSGKGTQATFLTKRHNIPHISTGDMLRKAIASGSSLGMSAQQFMNKGSLVPDDIMIALVKERLSEPDCQGGFVLDGFPRTVAQASALKDSNVQLDHVIEISVSDEEILKRLSGRRIHQASGRTYHVLHNPPKVAGKDDLTGEPLTVREDDKQVTISKRLAVFHQKTGLVIKFYEAWASNESVSAPKFHKVLGSQSKEQIFNTIEKALAAS